MMLLDNERLAALEDEFNEHPKGIELPNFIWLMESAINYPAAEKVDLIYGLIKLFNDIDINGDQHMEWSEFTQYIIDCVLEEDIRGKNAAEEADGAQQQEKEIVDQAYVRRAKKYQLSDVVDPVIHQNVLKKIISTGRDGRCFVLEENASQIHLIGRDLSVEARISPDKRSIYEQQGFIASVAFDPVHDLLGCVTTDKRLIFFEGSDRYTMLHSKDEFKRNYCALWYLPSTNYWVTSSTDNFLTVWKVSKTGLVFLTVV